MICFKSHRRYFLAGMLVSALVLTACPPGLRRTLVPMPTLKLVQRTPAAPCTAVLLPGILDSAKTFARHDFADLAATAAPGLDLVAADAHFGYYRSKTVLTRLHEDVIGPLSRRGTRVWLVGTSLGGVGSILYARGKSGTEPIPDIGQIEALVLLAPFLGEDDLLDSIEAAGGPLSWHPDSAPAAEEGSREAVGLQMWTWLLEWHRRGGYRPGGEQPRIVLGWGEDDDFARAGRLAATLLPQSDVFVRPGGHDWKTWRALWQDVLAAGVFDTCRP